MKKRPLYIYTFTQAYLVDNLPLEVIINHDLVLITSFHQIWVLCAWHSRGKRGIITLIFD